MTEIKPKSWKPLAIYIWIVVPIIAFCFIMSFSGNVTTSIHGFGVDSSDNLYIGKERKIEVYNHTELIRTIPANFNNYVFTIDSGEEIILSADYIYHYDLQGNEIKKDEDKSYYPKIARINHFVAENGDTYKKTDWFGYTKIIRNDNEVVYNMPMLDYIISILLTLSFTSMIVFLPIFLVKNLIYWAKNNNNISSQDRAN